MTLASPRPPLPPLEERHYTADDLWEMGPDAHFELLDGRLIPIAPAGLEHGFSTFDLATEIGTFVRRNNLGRCTAAETGFLLARDPDVVLAPDFAFIAASRLEAVPTEKFSAAAPDMVLETRSPNDRPAAIADKARRWLSYGTTVVIDADPRAKTLTLYQQTEPPETLNRADTLTLPDVLPGFALPLSQIF